LRFILSGLGNWYNGWSLTDQAVQLADKLGFWGAVIPDHYMWAEAFGQPQKDSTVESWIALTYLAAKTQKLTSGAFKALITCSRVRSRSKNTKTS